MEIIIQGVIMVIFIIFAVFFLTQFYNIIFRGYAPFISTKKKIIKKIIEKIKIKEDGAVYELGCGDAGFLRELRKKYPLAKLVGFEYNFFPYLIAQIQNSLSGSKISIKKKNIFKVNLGEADVLYCYLNSLMMKKLEEKIKTEGKPGLQIVSYQFSFPTMKASEVVEMDRGVVYFYNL